MQLIRVAERLGASSRRLCHPFPALMAGVKPWPCACAHGPKKTPHELIIAMMSCHTPVDELQLRNLDNPLTWPTEHVNNLPKQWGDLFCCVSSGQPRRWLAAMSTVRARPAVAGSDACAHGRNMSGKTSQWLWPRRRTTPQGTRRGPEPGREWSTRSSSACKHRSLHSRGSGQSLFRRFPSRRWEQSRSVTWPPRGCSSRSASGTSGSGSGW